MSTNPQPSTLNPKPSNPQANPEPWRRSRRPHHTPFGGPPNVVRHPYKLRELPSFGPPPRAPACALDVEGRESEPQSRLLPGVLSFGGLGSEGLGFIGFRAQGLGLSGLRPLENTALRNLQKASTTQRTPPKPKQKKLETQHHRLAAVLFRSFYLWFLLFPVTAESNAPLPHTLRPIYSRCPGAESPHLLLVAILPFSSIFDCS